MKRVEIRNFLIFFISVVVLITACIRNNSDSIYYDGDFTITSAKNWYDENKSGFDQMTNVDIFKTGNYTPLWDKAQLMEDSLYDVIEIPLKFKKSIGINVHQQSQNGADTTNIASLTKLLILKSKNTNELIGSLMNIHFDNGVIDYNIGYNKNTRQSFSGNIFYTRLNGEFVNGWMYKNGEIVKYANTAHETSTSATKRNLYGSNVQGKNYNIADRQMMSAGKQAATLSNNKPSTYGYDAPITDDERCMTTVVMWYERDCWSAGSSTYCTQWTYLYSDYYTYCDYGGNAGGGGGYSDYTTNTVPPPAPDSLAIDTTLKNFPCAKNILDSVLKLNNEISNIIKDVFNDSTVSNKLVFKSAKLTGKDGEYSGSVNITVLPHLRTVEGTIYLNEDLLKYGSKEIILSTMLHEVLHAYLHLERSRLTAEEFSQKYPSISVYVEDDPNNALHRFYQFITTDDHGEMASNYRTKLKKAILDYNNSLPDAVADALSVNGFFSQTNYPQNAINLIGYERDTRIKDPNTGQFMFKGSKCP